MIGKSCVVADPKRYRLKVTDVKLYKDFLSKIRFYNVDAGLLFLNKTEKVDEDDYDRVYVHVWNNKNTFVSDTDIGLPKYKGKEYFAFRFHIGEILRHKYFRFSKRGQLHVIYEAEMS